MTMHAPVEAYFASVQCTPADVGRTVSISSNFTGDGNWTLLAIDLPCGHRDVIYPRNASYEITVDTFACGNGIPSVYFWGVNTEGGLPAYIYDCNVSASSTLARVSVVPNNGDLIASVDSTGPRDELSAGNITQLLGEVLLNKWGSRGWNEAARWLEDPFTSEPFIALDEDGRRRFLNILLTTITKSTLADLNTLLSRSNTTRNFVTLEAQVRPIFSPLLTSRR
jgi:hypothetical protein